MSGDFHRNCSQANNDGLSLSMMNSTSGYVSASEFILEGAVLIFIRSNPVSE